MAGKMELRRVIEKKAFAGKRNVLGVGADCILKADTGAPNTAARVGTLCYVLADTDCYICTVAAGTWVKINA